MKHKIYIISFLLSSIFLLNACQKDIDKFVPDPVQPNQPDTNWVATITPAMEVSLLKSSLLLPVYTDSFFISSTNNSLLTSAGLNAVFTPNSLVNDSGQAVSGNIYLETLLLRKKGDMIRMDKPTTSNENILLSAGELLVRVKKDGMDVRLAQQNTISISYYDSLASTSMRLYYGDESNPLFFNWANNLDSAVNSVTAANRTYTIRTKSLGWIGVGKPIQNAGQANISLTLPAQFTNANTMAYLVNTNSLSVIKMKGDASIRKFTSSGLPFNSSFTAIIISKQGDNYYLGNQSFTTIPGTANNIVVVSPTIKTPVNITAYLDAL